MSKKTLFIAVVMLLSGQAAQAKWVEASSRHFLVYSDEAPDKVKAFADQLERFDRAIRTARKMPDPVVSPATRLVIYRVKDVSAVRRLAGMGSSSGLAGYYNPIVQGPYAVVPRTTGSGADFGFKSDIILFHEYAHHLQLASLDQPMPRWLSEGFAEFFSTARFLPNGSVRLGERVKHRNLEGQYGTYLPMSTMLEDKVTGDQSITLYLLGWALTHYLTFEPSRKGQLASFLADMAKGMDPLPAAQKNFGNIAKLDSEVNAYVRRASLPVVDMQPHLFQDLTIAVRTLTPAEAAIMPWRIESKTGVTKEEAPKVATEVRRVAASYPNDPLVLATLAEAELDAKNYAAAQTAAEKLLALQPRNVEGLIYKGRAIAELGAKETDSQKKSNYFSAARAAFAAANRIDIEDPEPLAEFYKSYEKQGIAPGKNGKAAIHYASDLMPQDDSTRLLSVVQYLRDNQIPEARQALIPIAYSPHGGKSADRAKDMMAKLAQNDAKAALAIYEKAKAEQEKKQD